MDVKKAWYSYLTYIFFTVITAVSLTEYVLLLWSGSYVTSGTNAFTRWIISSQFNYRLVMGLFIFSVYALLIVVFCLVTIAARKFRKKHFLNQHTVSAWECVIILLITAGGLAYKIYMTAGNIPDTLSDMSYLKWAQVSAGSSIPDVQHGASMLYLYILYIFMSFLGNKIMTAVMLQIALQALTLIVLYFAVRIWTGRVPAVIVCAVFAFSSIINEKLFEANPECLLFLIYSVMLLLCGIYCRSIVRIPNGTAAFLAILLGAAVGSVCYMDLTGFTLFVMLLVLFIGTGNEKLYHIIDFLLIVIAAFAAVVGLIALKSFLSGNGFMEEFSVWTGIMKDSFKLQLFMYSSDHRDISMLECFLLTFSAAAFIPAFWLHDTDHESCFMILMAVAWTPMTGISILSENIFSIFVWSVMAGIGIQGMTVHPRREREKMKLHHRNKTKKVVISGNGQDETDQQPDGMLVQIPAAVHSTVEENMPENRIMLRQSSVKSAIPAVSAECADTVQPAAADSPVKKVQPAAADAPVKKVQSAASASEKKAVPSAAAVPEKKMTAEMSTKDYIDQLWAEINNSVTPQPSAPVTKQPAKTSVQPAAAEPAATLKTASAPAAAENKVKYIKNPLPQPVRHKKQMSFGHSVSEDGMSFDVDVNDNDDFDL